MRLRSCLASLLLLAIVQPVSAAPGEPPARVFLPYIAGPNIADPTACVPVGESYGALDPFSEPTDRPAEAHADLNLALRGYLLTTGYLGLVNYNGAADPGAPQLAGLFTDRRAPQFAGLYQVGEWDWACNCRAGLISDPPVTLIELAATTGEMVRLPDSGYSIGSGYEALVLYAAPDRLTLKYTRVDNVVQGYTLHLEGLCVAPELLAAYRGWNAAGRTHLPALRSGQSVGRAAARLGVAIRDNGAFLDPRSRKDWWAGY